MPDATKRPIADWRETEWLQHLQRQAQQLTACPDHTADLAHACLLAFYNHHRCYPWQRSEPAHALRWRRQKLRALVCDAHRHAERHPCLALEALPESVACVDIAAQVQSDIDGERFVASLPPRLRAAVELRLAGYSWDEAAHQLGVSASTLRGYLPELRAKFVDFFGEEETLTRAMLGEEYPITALLQHCQHTRTHPHNATTSTGSCSLCSPAAYSPKPASASTSPNSPISPPTLGDNASNASDNSPSPNRRSFPLCSASPCEWLHLPQMFLALDAPRWATAEQWLHGAWSFTRTPSPSRGQSCGATPKAHGCRCARRCSACCRSLCLCRC